MFDLFYLIFGDVTHTLVTEYIFTVSFWLLTMPPHDHLAF